MSSTAPGICLASTAKGKKLVNELKGEHPLAILVPTNITNRRNSSCDVLLDDGKPVVDSGSNLALLRLHIFVKGFDALGSLHAKDQPIEKTVDHDFGLAVMKEAAPKHLHSRTERFHLSSGKLAPHNRSLIIWSWISTCVVSPCLKERL